MNKIDITCPFCEHTGEWNSFNVYDNIAFCNKCGNPFPLGDKKSKMSTIKGGKHIGKVRRWIQWNAVNGSDVLWGSHEPLRFSQQITPAMLERLAQDIRSASMDEIRGDLERIKNRFDRMVDETDTDTKEFSQMVIQGDLKNFLERLEGF